MSACQNGPSRRCHRHAGINASSGQDANDCAVSAPFTDNADKGDLRIDFQQDDKNSWFLKVSDRKETGINYPSLPEPLDSQGNGNGRQKILDQQLALGYTRLIGSNKVLDARLALSGTRAGKYTLAIGNTAISFPGLPTNPVVAGGLPTTALSGSWSSFGRQNTNPQWQNPSVLDPKLNFAWVMGKHSLKLGGEYEHIWMEVEDSNPLYGYNYFQGGYSLCNTAALAAGCASKSAVSDTYWADLIFGARNQYALATYFIAHLLQTNVNGYVQDDWKATSKLTLNLGLRWEYGSPYSEANNNLSNFDPTTGTMQALTLPSGFVSPNCGTVACITGYSGSGVYGKTLVNPDWDDYAPRVGFAYSLTPTLVMRGGFGTSYVHYTRAGSGDILAINSPVAQFVNVAQPSLTSTSTSVCQNSATASASCFVTLDQGFPANLVSSSNFSAATANITYVPKDTKDSYVQSYFFGFQKELAKNTQIEVDYIGNRGQRLQGFLNANQQNPAAGVSSYAGANSSSSASEHFARPFPNWGAQLGANFIGGDITEAYNGFFSNFNGLQAKYEQRFVDGLTLLNAFTWEHSLDNASASLEGNTPSPQDANNLRADYSQSDYNQPLANVTSLVYDLPVGRGKAYLNSANSVFDAIVGGWQLSAIDTLQSGTPFNVTYSPATGNIVSPQISATYRGANEYRPNRVAGQDYVLCHSGHSCLGQKNATNGAINYINLGAFSLPATYSSGTIGASPFGNAPRNPARTPNFWQTDIDMNKSFNTPSERVKLQFRAEAYNILNHTNLYLPSSGMGSGGKTTSATNPSSGSGTVTATFEPRILQLGLKIVY